MICPVCRAGFIPKTLHQKYCSKKCQLISVHQRNIKAVERECEYCKKKYIPVGKNRVGKGGDHFCSDECRHNVRRTETFGQPHYKRYGKPQWKVDGSTHRPSGRTWETNGYVYVWDSGKRRMEHQIVMERRLGRPLTYDETIHHKNCIRNDNRDENLELWTGKHPIGARVSDLIAWAREFLPQYGLRVVPV